MRVLLVAGSFYPAVAFGGPIEANRALCRGLVALGAQVKVLTTNTNGRATLPSDFAKWRVLDGYEVFYGSRWFWRDLSPGLALEVARQVPTVDVVHVTGTYNWFLPVVVHVCRLHGKPVVVSPRASLLPEARGHNGIKKRVFDAMLQRPALAHVAAFHATAESEADALHLLLPGTRAAIIPNGVYVPDTVPEKKSAAPPYVLYMGRLHPYKRIDRILMAFRRAVAKEGPDSTPPGDWSLCIAGDGEPSYRRELEGYVRERGLSRRVRFVGQVAGEQKARLLAGAEFVVQAPNPENFGNVVAEALAHRRPALVGKGLPWAALDDERCGFWVDDSEEGLAAGMRRLMALAPAERSAMGERGRRWMARSFSWDTVAKQMLALYEDVSGSPLQPTARTRAVPLPSSPIKPEALEREQGG